MSASAPAVNQVTLVGNLTADPASWPRSRVTYPPRSPNKTTRSCLACKAAESIAEDPLGRRPTFGIVAGTAAASSRKQPRRLRPGR